MAKEYIMTPAGKRELEERLEQIKNVEMPDVVEEIARARAQGDLSENAEYTISREHQAQLQNELNVIMEKLANAVVLDEKSVNDDVVSVGCAVEVIVADVTEGMAEVERMGLSRSDVIVGFLSEMSVIDMRANRDGIGILSELTPDDYVQAGGELLGSKRYKREDLLDKGFSDAELASKIKAKNKVDKSKCAGLSVYTIVGSHDANMRTGRISNESLVGKSLLGKSENDVVKVRDLIFKIVDISVDKSVFRK